MYSSPAPFVRHIRREDQHPSSRRPPEQERASLSLLPPSDYRKALSLEKIRNVFVPVIGRHYHGEILTESGNLATLDKVETSREIRGVAKGDFFGCGEIYAGWSRSVE